MFAPLCQVNQWINCKSFNILNLRLFVEIFLELWPLTILKVCIAYRHWRSKFPRSGKNQNTKSYLALVRIFLVAELKSATGRFGTGRLWPCIWANFFWGTEKSITKNLWIISYTHFFFVMIQRIFSSWALLPSHFTTFLADCESLFVSCLNKVGFPFLFSKGLLCT